MQLTLTVKMTTAQLVETSVTANNGPIQDCVHSDAHAQQTYWMTPGFKPFTVVGKAQTLNLWFFNAILPRPWEIQIARLMVTKRKILSYLYHASWLPQCCFFVVTSVRWLDTWFNILFTLVFIQENVVLDKAEARHIPLTDSSTAQLCKLNALCNLLFWLFFLSFQKKKSTCVIFICKFPLLSGFCANITHSSVSLLDDKFFP